MASAPAYPNYWPGWEADVLRAAGLPVTKQNVTFLANWHSYEGSVATNNPLNTTAYAPVPATVGTGSINGAGVQNYPTAAQGAQATAAFLRMPNFTNIFAALKSGDPYAYTSKSTSNLSNIVSALRKWGSTSFAAVVMYEQQDTQPITGSVAGVTFPVAPSKAESNTNPETGKSVQTASQQPTTTLGELASIWSTLTSANTWRRVGLLILGTVMMLFGVYMLARKSGAVPNVVPIPA